jgi:hypothetical protein
MFLSNSNTVMSDSGIGIGIGGRKASIIFPDRHISINHYG